MKYLSTRFWGSFSIDRAHQQIHGLPGKYSGDGYKFRLDVFDIDQPPFKARGGYSIRSSCIMIGINTGTDGLSYHRIDEAIRRFDFTQKDFEEAMAVIIK